MKCMANWRWHAVVFAFQRWRLPTAAKEGKVQLNQVNKHDPSFRDFQVGPSLKSWATLCIFWQSHPTAEMSKGKTGVTSVNLGPLNNHLHITVEGFNVEVWILLQQRAPLRLLQSWHSLTFGSSVPVSACISFGNQRVKLHQRFHQKALPDSHETRYLDLQRAAKSIET